MKLGKDRGYTHEEIQKHMKKFKKLQHSDQRIKTCFLILASAGIRIGALGLNSYNDNWDLVNYTSELRDPKGNFFAFVDFNGDEGKIRECPHCLEIHNKLKPKILKKGEVRAPDYDQWIQCWECGNIYPIYQSYPRNRNKRFSRNYRQSV